LAAGAFGRGTGPLQIAGDGSFAFGWPREAITLRFGSPEGGGSGQFI
jgi:hypothetical protein